MAKGKKSGDSKLADAEAAREKERADGGKEHWSAQDRLEHLPHEVEDAIEKKKAVGDYEGAARSQAAMDNLIKAVELLEKKVVSLESTKKKLDLQSPAAQMPKCPTCRQILVQPSTGRGVCGGVHKMVVVVPRDMELWRFFKGVTINGVTYCGRSLLPDSLIDEVLAGVGRWEHSERMRHQKQGKMIGLDQLGANPAPQPIV